MFKLSVAIPCRLEGFTYGDFEGKAYPGESSEDNWKVKSNCGKVQIQVPAWKARQRLVEGNGIPTFLYD
jgi:hypothetical protein